MGMDLTGSAFVTGAGSGIGRACVLQLVRDGCTHILATDINIITLQETVELAYNIRPDVQILSEAGDISDETTINRLIETAVAEFGRIDYALNIAGVVGKPGPTHSLEAANYDWTMGINARSMWLCQRAQISQMLQQKPVFIREGRFSSRGAIVNVSSICGLIGMPNNSPYTMSKHAVIGLVKGDSTSFAAEGIRVNAVCPGIVQSPFLTLETQKPSEEYAKTFCPMKRLGIPEEIADVVVFLCSSRASFISGASIPIDGGHTAQ